MFDPIPGLIVQVNAQRLRADLFYLSHDPLPFRKLNYTRPGQARCSLYEADDFIQARLESYGYRVEREGCQVQAFRCDPTKPIRHQYSPPLPEDPWYTAYNLYAKKLGTTSPDEIVVVISHKDSQSWVDSPGAYDNAVGVVGNLEIARILRDHPTRRSVWFIFCNEEHTPWTSMTAARTARARGDHIVAVFNIDSIGGKGQDDIAAGRKTNVTRYSAPEGKWLADLMAEVNDAYAIGLIQSSYLAERPNDDDGSYVKEGFGAAILNVGSFPYADPNYHLVTDRPEFVDIENVRLAVQASLAAVVRVADGYNG